MTKKNNKKKQNELYIAIVSVLAIVVLVAGSTYAYWSWRSDTANQTNVVVTVKGGELIINGPKFESNTLRPTNDCDGSAALFGEVPVTVINYTETLMRATPRLDVTLTPKSGRTLSSAALSHLHWALVETTSSTSKTCATPDYQGTFDKVIKPTVTKDGNNNVSVSYGSSNSSLTPAVISGGTKTTIDITKNIANFSPSMTSATQASNTLSFVADKATYNTNQQGGVTAKNTTKKYTLYIWLDDGYTYENIGNTVSDPMQDLKIVVQWSPNSTLIQE